MKYILTFILSLLFFSGCTSVSVNEPAVKKINNPNDPYDYLNGFYDDNLDEALKVFKLACEKSARKKLFQNVCINAYSYNDGKEFFTQNFTPRVLVSNTGDLGLITGYFEPLLFGSAIKTDKYKYPIYKIPNDLVIIKDKKNYPEFERYRYRAKIVDGKYIPYDTREQIENRDDLEAIVYVDNKVDLFFLHVQGSGRVQLESGEVMNIGYASQNGRKYFAIGRHLVENGHVDKKDISLQTIKKYLKENPEKTDEVLNLNPSYIFFEQREQTATGSLSVPLVANRNVAVDTKHIPLGMPVFIETFNPKTKVPMNRLVIAADTGGAIKGEIRLDFFFGYGNSAGQLAGLMKEKGRVFLFIPNI